ncbi:hypothetical protein SK128_001857, partial [Halocaridina rubra]
LSLTSKSRAVFFPGSNLASGSKVPESKSSDTTSPTNPHENSTPQVNIFISFLFSCWMEKVMETQLLWEETEML